MHVAARNPVAALREHVPQETVAKEQEMMAHVQENRAKVVLSEAEIPMAIADAFRKGNMGVVDYYNLRNVQADTEMRNSIAGTSNARREPVVATGQ